ncbi:hypothetical protein PV325_013802 [Microctonus aethiopoides]|uniref:USP domain-containing protein n=1 Tax=Microctonus aethiopoides TaxID=144406 RepID=A0AA39FWT7_9HYME|nr:hypothetical protein PV325_013802 [Microctonus aethiopoides]KAK0177299.1 hypothetical protein PV328_001367 [Microctonus aethiopoides]
MDFTVNEILLGKYIKLIISSTNKEQINEAWKHLENFDKSENQKSVNLIETVKIIIAEDQIENVNEIPKLLKFFPRMIDENPFEVNDLTDINNEYIDFLKRIVAKSKNFSLFCHLVDTLLNHHEIYLPNGESIVNFSKAIVHCLSLFRMPANSTEISKFKENIGLMHEHLTTAINLYGTKRELILILMDTLYQILTDIELNSVPGSALVVIIELVKPELIPEAVQFVIKRSSNDQQLSQLVSILSTWLTHWLKHKTLFLWVQECIEHLQNERRYSVLNSISDICLNLMLERLIFPIAREYMMPIVHTMLIHMSTPSLFIKIIPDIVKLFDTLRDENPQDLFHIQNLVDCVNVLMIRFQGLFDYESLKKSFPMKPHGEVIKELMTTPLWKETTDKLAMSNYNIIINNNKQVGLDNLGNTCYMNSVLQALVMTPQFCNQILIYNEYSIKKNSILYELQRLFALLVYSQRPCLSPTDFSRVSKPTYFTPGQQQDSAEFLCHLLDVLYEQEQSMITKFKASNVQVDDKTSNNDIKMNLKEDQITTEDNNSNSCDTTINNIIPSKDHSNLSSISQSSLIYRVFGGESNTTYQCNKCYTSSHNNDHYWELQLSFPEEIDLDRKINVQDLINYYLTPEKLTGDNMYHCNRCNSLCDAQRIIKILRAPAHLILTLKHFHYDIDSRLKAKLFHKVFYNDIIQIPVSNDDDNDFEKYQLYAAVVHSGYSMDYGHYFTFAKDRTEKWYKFNDSCVTETTLNEFYQLEAPYTPYILFYVKITNNYENGSNDKPILQTLSDNIRNIIEIDTTKYEIEQKNYVKNRITRLPNDDYYQLSTSFTRQRDNNDDDNPPPTNCRDSVDIPPNRFLY